MQDIYIAMQDNRREDSDAASYNPPISGAESTEDYIAFKLAPKWKIRYKRKNK